MKSELPTSALALSLVLSLAACSGDFQPVPRPASGVATAPRGVAPRTAADTSDEDHGEVSEDSGGASAAPEEEVPAVEVGPGYDGPTGTIVGAVHFEGDAPERKELAIGGAAGCEHDATPLTETVIVNDGMLQNVFVYVSKGLKGYELGSVPEPLVLDQRGCLYQPHVSGVVVGQTVRASNSDQVSHNVHVLAKRNDAPNKTQSAGMKPLDITFSREEVPVTFVCDIHPWMKAYVCVQDHPFFAVSDGSGAFRIPDLPPGKYGLTAWHEKYGKKKQGDVVVSADGEATVRFDYP